MNLIRLAIRQPVTVTVGVILILLAGLIALERLPIQLTPNVENTIITVSTFWEGASPEEIEQNVIDKQEERLLGVSNLRLMTSTSAQSTGTIRLEFQTGTDKEAALREVSDKLREVPDYPENVDEPVIEATDPENRDFIAWFIFSTTDPSFDIRVLQDLVIDRVEPTLERVAGVAEINTLGGREREVQIRIDPVRLAQYGISPTAFAQVIRNTNQDISAGQRAEGKLDVRIRTVGQYQSLEQIERTVIAHTPARGEVLVRDVAEVVQTFKEADSFVRSRGVPVIAINAEREIGSNIMAVMEGLKAEVERLNAPGGMFDAEARRLGLNGELKLTQAYDQTIYIEDALRLVRNNIWIGGALAMLVLILFLRSLRSLGIIAVAIPISVIGAVVTMVAMGRSINVVSLAGMAFAVGMVVDNAIVVLENIFRHLEMGKRPPQAAYDGAREVWGAVLASTLTTVAVFVPILLIEEEAGQLFRDIALAICAAVALSLIVSISLIPTAAARILKHGRKSPLGRDGKPRGFAASFGRVIYRFSGSWLVRLSIVFVMTGAAIAGTIWLKPPADYLPKGNRNLVFGLVIPPPGYNIEQFNTMADRMESVIAPYWEAGKLIEDEQAYEQAVERLPAVPTFDMMTQQPGDPVVPPTLENYFLVFRGGIMFHGGISDNPKRAVDMLPLFIHATRPQILPGTIAFPFQVPLFSLGGATGSAVKLQLAGPQLDEVVRVAGTVYRDLGQKYGFGSIQPIPSNFQIEYPEVQVRPDLVRLSELGLSTDDVGLAVRAYGDGAIIDEYTMGGETIDLKIIAQDAIDDPHLTGFHDLPVATPSGHTVSLGSIAEIRRTGSAQEIARVGRQRSVSFEVTPPRGKPLEEMMAEMEEMFAGYRDRNVIPPAIQTSLAGSASKLTEVKEGLLGDGSFVGTMGSSMVLALIVVYLLMCVLFQSFLYPLVIMFSVPLATLGGFLALSAVYIWSKMDPYMPLQMLDVVTMLGFVLLIGVVVNNAILIVHQTLNFMEGRGDVGVEVEHMTPRRAIAESVRTRVRPIFMSTFTSVGGMLPLVLMPGSGSELYRGLGSVVVGGLLVSTVFTLLLVPMLLSLVFDVKALLTGRKTSEAPVTKAEGEPAKSPKREPAAASTVVTARE